jgi:hypothetical protein
MLPTRFAAFSLVLTVLVGCGTGVERFYVSAAVVSASAFDLSVEATNVHGRYLYSYLSAQPGGPQVRSLTFDVRFRGSVIVVRDGRGYRCQPWHVEAMTPESLTVNFGSETVTYVKASPSAYQTQLQALGLAAASLRGHGGGLVDYFKPDCSQSTNG